MPPEITVVSVFRPYGGTQSLFVEKDAAVDYAEQIVTDPEVKYAEVRQYNIMDLINYALAEMHEASANDEHAENGELIGRFE